MGSKKKLSVYIDAKKCISCGTCAILAGKTFKQEGDKPAEVLPKTHDNPEEIKLAKDSCPAGAIKIK